MMSNLAPTTSTGELPIDGAGELYTMPRLAVNMLPEADGTYESPYIDGRGSVEIARNFQGRLNLHLGNQAVQIFGAQIAGTNLKCLYSPDTSIINYYLRNRRTGQQMRFGDGLSVVDSQGLGALTQEETVTDGRTTYASRLFIVSGATKALLGLRVAAPDVVLEVDVHSRNLHISVAGYETAQALGMLVTLEFPPELTPISS